MPTEPRAPGSLRLVVFTDAERVPPGTLLAKLERLCGLAREASVLCIVRDYGLPVRERLELGRALASVTSRTEQLLGVAERADLARLLGAHALHLPEHGLRAADARALLGPDVFLTRACHDAERVADEDCALVLLSPIGAARKGRPPLGVAGLARARAVLAQHTEAPRLFALGGVDAPRAAECLLAGADGVAVIEAALADDPRALLAALAILRKI